MSEKTAEELNECLTDEDVDQLRKSWEISDHWLLRRDFIVSHQNKYPFNRLLCLAQLYVNIEVLGNEYDPKLMTEIKDLSSDLKSYRDLRQKKCQNK